MMQQNLLSRKNSLRVYFGSTILFLFIFISLPIYGPFILLSAIFPFSVRYKVANYWITAIFWVLKVFCGLTQHIEGLENLPKNQAYIILSKHQSAWETLAFRLFLPKQTNVLKRSLTWIPIGGWALATLKPIAIDRENPKAALRILINQGIERLKEGFVVIIFPEGTRVAPGENKKFNVGGALLAEKSEYPVIPLAHNAGELWPRYSFLKYPGTVQVRIGPAIVTRNKKAKQINSEAHAWIAHAMDEISNHQSL